MKLAFRLFTTAFFATTVSCHSQPQWPEAKATIIVTDQDNRPVAGAEVRAGGGGRTIPGPKTDASGSTDVSGRFTFTLQSDGRISYFVRKPGYYDTHGREYYLQSRKNSDKEEAFRTGQWKPWNATIPVLLRKIINPIPMYARWFQSSIPITNQPVGYDLIAGDWIAPYGQGKSVDIILTKNYAKRAENDLDNEIIVTFPNPGDGIQPFETPPVRQGSWLRSPHEAPEHGYVNYLARMYYRRRPGQDSRSEYDPNRNYFIRVRTVLDEQGNVKNAHYGKIYGDFMQFCYYLNPTPNSRNMEFDPKRNLLKGLKSTEQVNDP
jgi:hypothetical protein